MCDETATQAVTHTKWLLSNIIKWPVTCATHRSTVTVTFKTSPTHPDTISTQEI